MKNYKFIFWGLIVVAAIFFTCTIKAESYSEQSIKIINALEDIKLFPSALDGITAAEIDEVVEYMEQHPDRVIPWYYAQISDYIYRYKKDENKALQFYYRGLVRIQEDVKMCKDPEANAFKHAIDNEVEETNVLRIKEEMKNPWNLYYFYKNELKWDEKNPRYYNPYWACDAMHSSYEKVPVSEYQNVLKKYRKDMRNLDMWDELIKESASELKRNRDYYNQLIQQLK